MKFSTKQKVCEELAVTLDGKILKDSTHVCFLGLTIDLYLDWNQHMSTLSSKLCGILVKLKNKLDKNTKFIIYRALAKCHLTYIATVWAWKFLKCTNIETNINLV